MFGRKLLLGLICACIIGMLLVGPAISADGDEPADRGGDRVGQKGGGDRGPGGGGRGKPQKGGGDRGPGGGGDRGGDRGPGGGGFSREDMLERMGRGMRERLQMSEEEWQVIGPRMMKVMTLSRETRGGGGGFGGSRGPGGFSGRGPGGGDSQRELSAVDKAGAALSEVLQGEEVSSADIKAKLTALRSAREKARQDLAKAEQDLRQLLSLRQEAQLVMMGILN